MATNVTEATLTARVRSLFNEPVALTVSDADILVWIDQAVMEIASRTGVVQTSSTTFDLEGSDTQASAQFMYNIKASTGDIAVDPLTVFKVASVLYTGHTADEASANLAHAKSLLKIHPRSLTHTDARTPATPKYWFCSESYIGSADEYVIGVWPPPNAANNGILMRVFWYILQAEYASSGPTYLLPEWIQEHIAWFAYAKCLERDGKLSQSRQYMSYFDNMIAFHKADLIEAIDSKDMMVVPDFTRVAQ